MKKIRRLFGPVEKGKEHEGKMPSNNRTTNGCLELKGKRSRPRGLVPVLVKEVSQYIRPTLARETLVCGEMWWNGMASARTSVSGPQQ